MINQYLNHGLICLANLPAYWRYERARRQPRRFQEELLRSYLRRNAGTAFGQNHGFATIQTVEQFRERVPVRPYDAFEPWIKRIRDGEQGVLTTEPVLMMEKTSGSTGVAKYIPYTAGLRSEFQQAIGAWLADFYLHRPALRRGAQYWSISPASREREFTPGGLPIGFEDDTAYLGRLERAILRRVMAVPNEVRHLPSIDEFRRVTLKHLMQRSDLRLISVWNPSFLTLLLKDLPPGAEPRQLWPDLALISCWTSAAARHFLPELKALFPGVEIQGKGLLSTEGVVSFPRLGCVAAMPAITSHVLEFLDKDGRAFLVDELKTGRRYRVVITTGGGLTRYDTGDLVDVVAPWSLDFVGRGDQVSDLAGEKLAESFVANVLEAAAARFQLSGFLMLAPHWAKPPRYVLFSEEGEAVSLARFIEDRLRDSVHYDYCRQLGQLSELEAIVLPDVGRRYLAACATQGQRLGSVKAMALRKDLGWPKRLVPERFAAEVRAEACV